MRYSSAISPARPWLCSAFLALMAFSGASPAAQPYPSKPITLIVPYAPGGAGDILGRALQMELTKLLGQPVIVENKPGAGGNVGADLIARSTVPDGYTLLFTGASLASNPSLMRHMPFDPVKELKAVAGPINLHHIVVVNPELKVHSVRDLILHAKSNPGSLFFGSSGQGTSNHLAVELFKVQAGVDLVHVPYKSSGTAIPGLVAGETQVMFDLLPSSISHVKSGRVRALAVTGGQRLKSLPDLPTVAESGLPGYEYSGWFGVFTPTATPQDVIAKLNAAVNTAVTSPAFQARLEQFGGEASKSSPDSFGVFFRRETGRWAKLVNDGNLPRLE